MGDIPLVDFLGQFSGASVSMAPDDPPPTVAWWDYLPCLLLVVMHIVRWG